MIVDDLHVVGVPVVPDEADTVLIVDTNAVLATPVPGKRLKPVAGESCEVTRLYEEVWSEPTSKVAPRYGISDVGAFEDLQAASGS